MGLKENLKNYRIKNNLTLEEVALKLGISKPTLQRYESGVISNIPFDNIEKLAKIYNITPAQLMGWDEIEDVLHGMEGLRLILEHIYDSVRYESYDDTGSYDVILIKDNKKTIMKELPYKNLFEFLCNNIPMFIEMINSQYIDKEK